ncbi:MAG TPA: tetratricopeptide repeat protein [Thermoplasmata archaeon]|nr:tetratricopeptide repeat protein [Thermoplasmata archaeon]
MADLEAERDVSRAGDVERLVEGLDRIDLDRATIAGSYVRSDEGVRNHLKDFRGKVLGALSSADRHPTNLLLWGPPGSGKSYLVQQVARFAGTKSQFVQANLAQLDSEGLRAQLAEANSGPSDVVCLIDELDAQGGQSWPYELLLPALEPATRPQHRTVFCLAGSGGGDLEEFKARLRARPKGPDLLSRIPRGNEFSVPPLGPGDKLLVATSQLREAAASEGRAIREIEKFALLYLASKPELQSARQLRAMAAEGARRVPFGEDRFRYDHLFAPGDAENKRFWYEREEVRRRLVDVFVPIAPLASAAPWSPPPGTPAPSTVPTPNALDPSQRIAILPFRNISSDPADSYFSEGLTEELIATVSRLGGLRVIARTSVMRFRDGTKSAAETARELRVGTILEGSVRRAGDELRVTAQLVDVDTEEPVWSVSFDRRLENVFAIQQELARRIAESLVGPKASGGVGPLGRIPTRSLEAYDRYLQGRQRFFEATGEGLAAAVDLFERAIALDSEFALAHCGLAETFALQGNGGFSPLEPALERAERSVRRALQLDPDLGEAHAALAPILYNRYDWTGAIRELDTAIELEPNNVQAHFWRAVASGACGRPEEGLANALRAVELDPLNPRRRVILGQQYYWLRRYDEAITVLRSPLLVGSPSSGFILAYALLLSGRSEEAVAQASIAADKDRRGSVQDRIDQAAVFARGGQADKAREILRSLVARRSSGEAPAGAVAWIHVALGEFDEAITWYERAREERSIVGVPDLAVDPVLDAFRAFPGFERLRGLFGLPHAPRS